MPSLEYYRHYAKIAGRVKGKRQPLVRIREELYLASEYHREVALLANKEHDAGWQRKYYYHSGRKDGILRALELLDGTIPVCSAVELLAEGKTVNNVGLD
jgi:hypothetical protein